MRYAIILPLLMLSLTACTPARSNSALILPDVKTYTKAVQQQAAAEMASQACPVLNGFMVDYKISRDQTRAAKKIMAR